MKTTIKLTALFIIGFSFMSCSKDSDGLDTPTATNTIETVAFTNLESEVLALVNIHRESLGLNKVAALAQPYTEAKTHTNYMIEQGKISHDNFAERSRHLMTTANAKVVLENVAAGFTTAEGVLNGWLNSPLHKKNIEDPNVQFMGVSAKQSANGRNYYTQIFVGR